MNNPSKQKGTAWETAVVNYLNERGFFVERRALTGNQDKGDITGIPHTVIECKNANTSLWGPWMDETEKERVNDNAARGILVVKRRLKPVQQAFAVVPLWQMSNIMMALGTDA